MYSLNPKTKLVMLRNALVKIRHVQIVFHAYKPSVCLISISSSFVLLISILIITLSTFAIVFLASIHAAIDLLVYFIVKLCGCA